MKPRVMYVELKSGHGDSGPAHIGWVRFSKTGQTVYVRGRALERIPGGGISGNHRDVETDEEYWVSGPKRDGRDRHWAGSGAVPVDADAMAEYRRVTGRSTGP